jgi:predicted nucleotide-binding protein (sugar kinase/HSP70/actin superfamily)
MKTDMGSLTNQVDGLQSEMQEGFKEAYNETQEMKSEIKDINKTVIKIEDEHGKKLTALFDGYKQNSDVLKRIEKEVSKHEEIILRRIH